MERRLWSQHRHLSRTSREKACLSVARGTTQDLQDTYPAPWTATTTTGAPECKTCIANTLSKLLHWAWNNITPFAGTPAWCTAMKPPCSATTRSGKHPPHSDIAGDALRFHAPAVYPGSYCIGRLHLHIHQEAATQHDCHERLRGAMHGSSPGKTRRP